MGSTLLNTTLRRIGHFGDLEPSAFVLSAMFEGGLAGKGEVRQVSWCSSMEPWGANGLWRMSSYLIAFSHTDTHSYTYKYEQTQLIWTQVYTYKLCSFYLPLQIIFHILMRKPHSYTHICWHTCDTALPSVSSMWFTRSDYSLEKVAVWVPVGPEGERSFLVTCLTYYRKYWDTVVILL